MWYLVLVLLSACQAWHFRVCRQALTLTVPTVKVTHPGQTQLLAWLWVIFWVSSNLPTDMVEGITKRDRWQRGWGVGHIECAS